MNYFLDMFFGTQFQIQMSLNSPCSKQSLINKGKRQHKFLQYAKRTSVIHCHKFNIVLTANKKTKGILLDKFSSNLWLKKMHWYNCNKTNPFERVFFVIRRCFH